MGPVGQPQIGVLADGVQHRCYNYIPRNSLRVLHWQYPHFWLVDFFPIVTIWAGAFVTNAVTTRLLSRPHIKARLLSNDQSAGLLPALFLDGTKDAELVASLARLITLVNISAILWMEFSVFADISSRIVAPNNILLSSLFLFTCSYCIIYFILRYGLRGFVFADLFQGPLIAIGSISLLVGSFIFLSTSLFPKTESVNYAQLIGLMKHELENPRIPPYGGLLFAISCLFLNSFLVLVTEPHWLRVWMFGEKETGLQVPALSATCLIWLILVVIGTLASVAVTTDGGVSIFSANGGSDVVVFFLSKMANVSPLFGIAFWIAGMAALFSTSDAQIYSFVLIRRFDTRAGKIENASFDSLKPAQYSALAAAIFAIVYAAVRFAGIPFDQLVLLFLPSCLIIVPAIILAARGVPQDATLIWTSLGLYTACAVLAVLLPTPMAQISAIAAPLMPMMISLIALYKPKEIENAVALQ
jgi:hypothetical protein